MDAPRKPRKPSEEWGDEGAGEAWGENTPLSSSSQNLGLAAILTSSSFPGSPISLAFS